MRASKSLARPSPTPIRRLVVRKGEAQGLTCGLPHPLCVAALEGAGTGLVLAQEQCQTGTERRVNVFQFPYFLFDVMEPPNRIIT